MLVCVCLRIKPILKMALCSFGLDGYTKHIAKSHTFYILVSRQAHAENGTEMLGNVRVE